MLIIDILILISIRFDKNTVTKRFLTAVLLGSTVFSIVLFYNVWHDLNHENHSLFL